MKDILRTLGLVVLMSLLAVSCSGSGTGSLEEAISAERTPTLKEGTGKTGEGDRGRIAFIGKDGNIYTIDPKGDGRLAITDDANSSAGSGEPLRTYSSPTWAPGTGELAYIAVKDTPQGRRFSVEVSPGEGGEPEIVFQGGSEAPFYLYWSPNGKDLSFLANNGSEEGLSLWLAERGGDTRIVDRGQPYYWDWTPDGERFLAHVGGSSAANPDGARLSLLLDEGDPWEGSTLEILPFQAPAIAPDGRSVLLAAKPPQGSGGLVLMGLDGSFQSRLTNLQGSVAFGWSASGDHLAYVTAPGPTGALHGKLVVANVEDPSQPPLIVHDANGVTAFMWAPVRERLAYYVPTLPPDGQDQRISTTAQEQRLFLDLFIYDARQDESTLAARFLPTREFLEILPFFDQYQRSITFWSPDAESFVFSAELAGGASAIYTVEVSEPAAPVELAPGALAFWSMD